MDKIIFHDGDRTFTPEFQDGKLKCFYCQKIITQLKRHFGTHKDQIQNWGTIDKFCQEVSKIWRKEAVRKGQSKYEKTEQRKNRKIEYEKTDDAKEIRNRYEKTEQAKKKTNGI